MAKLNEHQKLHQKLVKEENAQIQSIRNRLSKPKRDAIDECVEACSQLHESIIEGVAGGHLFITLEDINRFVNGYIKLKRELTIKEVPYSG